MFNLRPAKLSDIEDLFVLSQHYVFISLPSDKELITKKIKSSVKAFKKPSKDISEDTYIFVLEDLSKSKVIGCSMIHAQHGTEDEPHFYLSVSQENKFSESINTGFIHGTLKLGYDTNGPTEIGGLILDPNYRNNNHKLGKQLSFVRFLYMALNKKRFKSTIHSELMPPFDQDGRSPLWEAIGRRFLNMEYHDADLLSRSNKEFILSLYPSDTIYETLLPLEARNAIGKVGADTQPVKRMLESIGFKYTKEVDPFDGGPHYRSELAEIKPVKELQSLELSFGQEVEKNDLKNYLVSLEESDHFNAIKVSGIIKSGKLLTSMKEVESLNFINKSKINVIPL
ncbi:arginine N-succinyltransferase [Halobacteriovorax sp. JY17]|uniref:arginine N-succinyltransferase n=1 Tax=Halobacteriovorax sp. JY17 TaxID=2014617 RepID=UPI000C5BDD43|nr:arginine N-succinyltransferase [Halobacteriovorax sp. JY17]PIK14243.1 MAG: arginine N-succinyltransferase [Halobacteriovorax sp. JY17]